jgi:TolB-like protein/Flp pilus assembly protein TadD
MAWRELRRRKVFRTAGLYIVGAWLVIQVADILFPAWGLPETTIRYLFIAAAACFPVALVFGWFFDITPQGVTRTEPAGGSEIIDLKLKPLDYIVLFALFSIGAAILFGSLGKIQEEIESLPAAIGGIEVKANSIAVLPFAHLDADPETRYFSDGVTEEVLHRLSTLGALHVLASTSSFAFRNSDESLPNIIAKLGVRYVLQGSVRRDNGSVRVTARLIDSDGFQIWSDSFDRRLESIFVIQTEIASEVSSQIVNEIIPPQQLPSGRTTKNMDAYNAYLRGRAYFDKRTAGWKQEAESAFRQAIELDPGFAPPHAGLATLAVNSGDMAQWEAARGHAEDALQLDPDLPLGHATLGLIRTVLGDPEGGLKSLRRAIELDPSLGTAYQWIAMPLARLGLEEEGHAMAEKGLAIDPLNPILVSNIADRESRYGNFDRAEQLRLRLTMLPEKFHAAYRGLYKLYEEWGRYADAVEAAKDDLRFAYRHGAEPGFVLLANAYAKLGLAEEADYWFERDRAQWAGPEPALDRTLIMARCGRTLWLAEDLEEASRLVNSDGPYDKAYLLGYGGLLYLQAGRPAEGVDWFERSIGLYLQDRDMPSGERPDSIDWQALADAWETGFALDLAGSLSHAYRELGRNPKADTALRFRQELYEEISHFDAPRHLEQNAATRVLSGDPGTALEHMERAVEVGWANYYEMVNDPVWAETIRAPEFQPLLEAAKQNVERQRAVIVAADRENDFRAEVERLVSVHTETR